MQVLSLICTAILWVGFPLYTYILHTAYIGVDSSILGTWMSQEVSKWFITPIYLVYKCSLFCHLQTIDANFRPGTSNYLKCLLLSWHATRFSRACIVALHFCQSSRAQLVAPATSVAGENTTVGAKGVWKTYSKPTYFNVPVEDRING